MHVWQQSLQNNTSKWTYQYLQILVCYLNKATTYPPPLLVEYQQHLPLAYYKSVGSIQQMCDKKKQQPFWQLMRSSCHESTKLGAYCHSYNNITIYTPTDIKNTKQKHTPAYFVLSTSKGFVGRGGRSLPQTISTKLCATATKICPLHSRASEYFLKSSSDISCGSNPMRAPIGRFLPSHSSTLRMPWLPA